MRRTEAQIVETTDASAAARPHQRKWLRYRESRALDPSGLWVFTDGSSYGSFAAIVVQVVDQTQVAVSHSGYEAPTHTRNVGAELNGAILGLSNAPVGSTVILVSDYLGIGAWISGWWLAKDKEVIEKLAKIRDVIRTRELVVRCVHHRGHQRDDSDFTRWNQAADALATSRAAAER